MTWLTIALYVIFAVIGSTLLKAGAEAHTLFTVPLINLPISLTTIIGIVCYGVSFVIYTILLSKLEVSFVSPVTVGLVYVLLMLTAVFFFREPMTAQKITGSVLVLAGVLLMIVK
jgi:drug/metabolite transporter (DMT)-like permease